MTQRGKPFILPMPNALTDMSRVQDYLGALVQSLSGLNLDGVSTWSEIANDGDKPDDGATRNRLYVQSGAPSGASDGDLWYDNVVDKFYVYDGGWTESATIGATIGTDLYDSLGTLLEDDGILNDRILGQLSRLNWGLDIVRADGTPAGWWKDYTNQATNLVITYNDAARTEMLIKTAAADINLTACSAAFPVDPQTEYTVTFKARRDAGSTTGGLYCTVPELDGLLDADKLGLSADTLSTQQDDALQIPTRLRLSVGVVDKTVTTTDQEFSITWVPTATAKWSSVVFSNWNNLSTDGLIISSIRFSSKPIAQLGTNVQDSGGGSLGDSDLLNTQQEWADVQDGSSTRPDDNANIAAVRTGSLFIDEHFGLAAFPNIWTFIQSDPFSLEAAGGEQGDAAWKLDASINPSTFRTMHGGLNYAFPVEPGETLWVTARIWIDSAYDGLVGLGYRMQQADNSTLATTGGYTGGYAIDTAVTTQVTARDAWATYTKAFVVNDDARFAEPFWSIRDDATAGYILIDNLRVSRVQPNATVGATVGVDIEDSSGGVLTDGELLNRYPLGVANASIPFIDQTPMPQPVFVNNNQASSGWYLIAQADLNAAFGTLTFTGRVSEGPSGGRFQNIMDVVLGVQLGSGASPFLTFGSSYYTFTGTDISDRLRLFYVPGGASYMVYLYAFFDGWNFRNLSLEGLWAAKGYDAGNSFLKANLAQSHDLGADPSSGKTAVTSLASPHTQNTQQEWADVQDGGGTRPADNATQNLITSSASDPGGTTGDFWYDTTNKILYEYDGGWVTVANAYDNTNDLTDGANLGGTADWGSVVNDDGFRPEDAATSGETLENPTFVADLTGWTKTDQLGTSGLSSTKALVGTQSWLAENVRGTLTNDRKIPVRESEAVVARMSVYRDGLTSADTVRLTINIYNTSDVSIHSISISYAGDDLTASEWNDVTCLCSAQVDDDATGPVAYAKVKAYIDSTAVGRKGYCDGFTATVIPAARTLLASSASVAYNPDFDSADFGWIVPGYFSGTTNRLSVQGRSNASVIGAVGDPLFGDYLGAFEIVSTDALVMQNRKHFPCAQNDVFLLQGWTYTHDVGAGTPSGDCGWRIAWLDSASAVLSYSELPQTDLDTQAWERHRGVFQAPASTRYCRLEFFVDINPGTGSPDVRGSFDGGFLVPMATTTELPT